MTAAACIPAMTSKISRGRCLSTRCVACVEFACHELRFPTPAFPSTLLYREASYDEFMGDDEDEAPGQDAQRVGRGPGDAGAV